MHAGTPWFSFDLVYKQTAGYLRLASFKTLLLSILLCIDNCYLFDEALIYDHKK